MPVQGVIPSPEAWGIIQDVARDVRRNRATRKARRSPRRRNIGGGTSETCPEVHEITTTGSPSAGSATLTYIIDSVSDTVTIQWDDTAAEIQTALETHDNIDSGDVVVTGAQALPSGAIYIRFTGTLAAMAIALPTWTDSITGGDLRMRKAASHDWEA